MKTIIQLQEADFTFAQDIWSQISNIIPKILMVIGFVILAWIILKVVNYILKKILKLSKIDSLTTKLNEAELFGKNDYDIVPSKIVLKFVKYLIILIFIIIASESLGLTMVSEGIASFIGYLPVLISALLIFVIGVYLASIIKKAVQDTFKSLEVKGSNLVGNIVFYAIVVVVSITALNQAGIDTEIITSNLTLILGSVLLSFTIAFGLGARDIITRLLFGFYSRKNFEAGQRIKTKEIEGVIQQIDNICITIKTAEGVVVLPIKKFVDQEVEII
ncbi:small-conductance mechanosensitive channel [Lutibacter sp. A80]|uniref:mechanosensitive ion channel family protein n=1 Tax=Lutibacter sp. A80 TaxID=2918453 RepID=UPI001F06B5E7|nr:small-conductance mechanosensitive channel [Lutibacter sp. A80]UMB62091.1 small-conductance mechanosensitive channel [Lutibacter sp. A80]